MKTSLFSFFILGCVVAQFPLNVEAQLSSSVQAQQVSEFEGVANDIDKERRGPVVLVDPRIETNPDVVRLWIDAYTPNHNYDPYPIKFDIFIERRLFSSQYRSVNQTGPIGVDIGPDIATPPFKYTVVATLLHPNRQYTTTAEGEVSEESKTTPSTLDCTVSSDEETFTASNVTFSKNSEGLITTTFEGKNDAGETSSVTTSVTITGEEASGTLKVGSGESLSVTGGATLNGDTITSLSVSDADATFALECTSTSEDESAETSDFEAALE